MLNPLNEPIVVSWDGRTYDCDLTLGALAMAEGELNVGIIYPNSEATSLWHKPEAYRRTVFLYILLKSSDAPKVTMARCAEAVLGDKREVYFRKIERAVDRLMPQLKELWPQPEVKDESPLAESSGGPNSGETANSTSESANANSGA